MSEAIDILKSIDATLKEMLARERARRSSKSGGKVIDFSPSNPCTKCGRQKTCPQTEMSCSKRYVYLTGGAA